MFVHPNWISRVVILAIKSSSRTSTKSGRGSFHPRHTLQSYYDQTPPFIYRHNLLWRRLLLLRQILVLDLGHMPNIQINNELLGPRALHLSFILPIVQNDISWIKLQLFFFFFLFEVWISLVSININGDIYVISYLHISHLKHPNNGNGLTFLFPLIPSPLLPLILFYFPFPQDF